MENTQAYFIQRCIVFLLISYCLQGCTEQLSSHNPLPCPPCPTCPELPQVEETPKEIIDSDMSLEEALAGLEIPENIKSKLTIIDVKYIGYDSLRHRGQLVCDRTVAGDLALVFERLLRDSFPIEKMIPVVEYSWSDSLSMHDNNTSCFNYRRVVGGHSYSQHSYGRAVDINPRNNPYCLRGDTLCQPVNAVYDTLQRGTIAPQSNVVRYFRELGWHWGGAWRGQRDYQHFSRYGG